jgi:phospholipid/cholesterol/gamma-HCH transport system substrate-binding protein
MGAVVLAVAGIFLAFALSQSDLGVVKGYTLSASFANIGGLTNGADVRINGIKVGTVTALSIDQSTFDAEIKMSIDPALHLPKDTVASIASDGLLGSTFLKLEPGRSPDKIPAGGTIDATKNYEAIEDQVSKIIFLATDGGKSGAPNLARDGQGVGPYQQDRGAGRTVGALRHAGDHRSDLPQAPAGGSAGGGGLHRHLGNQDRPARRQSVPRLDVRHQPGFVCPGTSCL